VTRVPTTALVAASLVVMAEVSIQRSEPALEASAIGALRAITSGQRAYAAVNGGYASSLKTLAAACQTGQHGFVSPDLAQDPAVKSGYEIRLQAEPGARVGPRDCNGVPTSLGYYATATPVRRAGSPLRAFAVDQSGVIWSDTRGTPPAPPFTETGSIQRAK
jgi:hypothetical protein